MVTAALNSTHQAFTLTQYTVQRPFMSLLGLKFHFLDSSGQPFAFMKRKALTWRENLRIFTDESATVELLSINARTIVDFGAAYDVTDPNTGQLIGTLKRRGWKSMLRDEWIVIDSQGQEIGRIREDSAFLAFVRRTILAIIPQKYSVEIFGEVVGTVQQNWNFFRTKLAVDLTGATGKLDPRLGLAAVALLISIEGRQGQ